MVNWNFDPSQYEEKHFELIPAGDHRVRIKDVTEKTFKSGNSGYEITLEVSGHPGSLWYYLVLNPQDVAKTNQRIGDFFNSFGITNYAMGTGKQWIGAVGAVRVKHEEYNGNQTAKVAYMLSKSAQEKLAPWKGGSSPATTPAQAVDNTVEIPNDLPFDV